MQSAIPQGDPLTDAMQKAKNSDALEILETWNCYEPRKVGEFKRIDEVLVTAIRYKNTYMDVEYGEIVVAGTSQMAVFFVEGLNRYWQFDGYEFAFVIKPNGDALYYDYRDTEERATVDASQIYECVKWTKSE